MSFGNGEPLCRLPITIHFITKQTWKWAFAGNSSEWRPTKRTIEPIMLCTKMRLTERRMRRVRNPSTGFETGSGPIARPCAARVDGTGGEGSARTNGTPRTVRNVDRWVSELFGFVVSSRSERPSTELGQTIVASRPFGRLSRSRRSSRVNHVRQTQLFLKLRFGRVDSFRFGFNGAKSQKERQRFATEKMTCVLVLLWLPF